MKRQTILKSALCLFMALVCLPMAMQAKVEHLLPKVHVLKETKGTPFALQRAVNITDKTNSAALRKVFTDYGCTIEQGASATVTVQMVESIEGAYDYTLEGYDNEGYQLIVTENSIIIKAVKPIGVIRAAQTLAQLAEGYEENAAIETVEITDWAAFKLRGYMHDVGRSFISVEELKKHIDLLSRFKVNTFHWHFTENQAWRFEVIDNDPNNEPDYTKLTSDESMTRFAGQYYTQEKCREVAEYAQERGVTIIPEIDMPGHSAAFKRAMGFSMQTDEGVAVLKEVLTQVASVFPDAPYIHIGADEETITYSKDGKGFLAIMADHIHGLGKKLVVWNPISGVTINNTMCDMTQMWSSNGKNISGVPDIDCRYNYTNHFDVFADVVGIYKSNIYYANKGSEEIAGTISAYWNDRKMETEEDIVKQNNMYANVLASAERAWIGSTVDGEEGYIEKLGTTLPNSGEVYEEFKSWEERFLFHKANSLKDEPIPYVKQTNVRWRITEPFPNGGNASATSELDQYATSTEEGLIPETFTHEGKTYYTGMATGAGIYLRHTWGNNIIPTYYGSTNYSNMTSYAWTYVYSPEAQTVGAQIEFQNYGRSEHDQAPDNGKWDRKGSDIWINGQRIAPPTWDNAGFDPGNEDDLKNENFTARTPIEVTLKQGWNKVFIKLPYVGASNVRLNKWMFTFVLTDLEGKNAVESLIYSPNQCMDEATEAVAVKVSEIKRDRGNLIGTTIGLWDANLAETLDAKVAEIEATYSVSKTAEERDAQVEELTEAWTTFKASLTEANMNKPVSGNYYRMYTPLRDNRYVTSNGIDAAITGNTDATAKTSVWQFVSREDGSYDIINLANGGYITTSGDPLKTVTTRPNTGWTIKKAENPGNVIVVSGSAQFNQQNHTNYHLLNWGSGTNTTDEGCQYRLEDVTTSIPPQPLVKLVDLTKENYPYAIDDVLADKVFAKENITIALDVMMPASLNGRQALVCAADPTQAVTDATKDNSPYIAYGLYGSNPVYLPSSRDGDRFTYKTFTASANTKYKVVYVIDKTNKKFYVYVDGVKKEEITYPQAEYQLQSFSNFATNNNAKLYIGGGVVSSNASYDKFGGQVRSVQFFEGALDAAKIAEIEYPELPEDAILESAAEANSNMNIYGMQRYLGLIKDAGNGLEGNGQFVCNYPASTSQESGNAYANLIDGNYTTFFHSGYGNTIGSGSHYLQADLGKAVKNFRFYFKKRSQNNDNRPTKITIEGSNDKETWNEVKVISSGLPTDANVLDYYSEEIASTTAYQHYRFTVNTTAGGTGNTVFFTFSEFYIFPSEYTKVKETFDAVRAYRAEATVETATALNTVYAWNKGLTEGSPIVGVESYIYADTYKDGAFLNRYLYNNNGSAALTTELQSGTESFIWTPAVTEDGKYNFKNKVNKYLAHKGMSDNAHNFTVAATTHHMGVTLHTQGSNYWVIKNADGSFDQSSTTYDQKTTNYCTDFVFIPTNLYEKTFIPVVLISADKFENGGIYTFVTARGWMGAKEGNDNVISTARTSVSDTNTDFFKWTVYKSTNGNYYLYNLGKQQFMGMQTANNTEIDFVTTPAGRKLTFKQSSSADYPIMLSTDNAGVVNHSTNHGGGLINWTGGWNTLNDEGSNHQVTLVGILDESKLTTIANLVEAYDKTLPVKAEVIGLGENNPNTHFGSVRATSASGSLSIKLKTANINEVAYVDYDGTQETTIDFTREYRGFEFQGYYLGEESLGKSFTLTEAQKSSISAVNPIVAKFTTTDEVTLFYDDDPKSYRIPAIGKTSTGRLIAVSDYRHNLDDIGMDRGGTGSHRIDLVIRTSDDNGKTWSEKQTIAEGTDNRGANDCAFGDAAIAVVGQKVLVMAAAGDVIFVEGTAESHNRTWRIYSKDNGVSWEKEDISETLFIGDDATIQNGYTAFFGSGKLAVDENFNGTGVARIYGAMLIKNASGTYNNFVIYTDDFGANWKILGGSQTPVANQDEPKVEILPSGQILLSARRGGGRQFNVFTYGTGENDKANGVGTWNGNKNGCDNEGSNSTNGEIYLVDAKKADGSSVKLLLQSQPVGGGTWDRADVSIWYKEINGEENYTHTSEEIAAGWTKGMQVSHQLSAYSTMVMQEDGKIAFFFEEAPCYADNYVRGYCMVYIPLTIENITKGNYFSKDATLPESVNVNVVLTDAQGNTYNDVFTCALNGIESTLTTKYPFITLGTDKSLSTEDGNTYTYTNTVNLPFKVSSAKTTVWHNIYWPANTNTGHPVYLSASSANDTYVPKVTEAVAYGNSSFNTADYADKTCWAIYNVDNGFTFKFKNKLTGKFIQVTSVASGNGQNVKYVDEAGATTFELDHDKEGSTRLGDYALKASINNTVGYLCSTSATGYHYATHYNGKKHAGAWLKFIEAPDYTALIASITEPLASGLYGDNLGQYKPTGDTDLEAIRTAMENSSSVKLNTLNSYKNLLEGATLNMPRAGQYFRVAYDYGGNVGKLYMQSTKSSVKGLQFAAETGNASVWVYYDGGLYSYVEGKNLREHDNDRGLSETKTTAEFSASARAMGKYNIKVGSFVHANSSNGNYFTDHCSGNGCTQHDLILESVDMRPSAIVTTIGEHEIATFYANSAMAIPAGVTAYVATTNPVSEENGEYGIYMTAIEDGIIPAETGVVIRGNAGDYTFTPVESAATTAVTNNLMRGYAGPAVYKEVALESGYTTYVLAVEDSQVGFYKKESAFKVYNNKAYLQVPKAQNARSLVIRFGDEETTDIENSEITNQNTEIVFDLQGRRVLTPTKGIYIVNGKKMVK